MKLFSHFAGWVLFFLPVLASAADATRPIEIRAYLNDPVNPGAVFQVKTSGEALNKVPLAVEGLSKPMKIEISGEALPFFGDQPADAKAGPPLLAAAAIPSSVQRCIVVITPAAKGAKLPYHAIVVNDAEQVFPFGESRALNLTIVPMAMQVGSVKLALAPGAVTPLKEVREVNEFHMGQTNFYMKSGESWMPFAERQIQYLKNMRRVFIVYATSGSRSPTVTTLVDYEPEKLESKP